MFRQTRRALALRLIQGRSSVHFSKKKGQPCSLLRREAPCRRQREAARHGLLQCRGVASAPISRCSALHSPLRTPRRGHPRSHSAAPLPSPRRFHPALWPISAHRRHPPRCPHPCLHPLPHHVLCSIVRRAGQAPRKGGCCWSGLGQAQAQLAAARPHHHPRQSAGRNRLPPVCTALCRRRVKNTCCKTMFQVFHICILQVFHMDIAKLDRNVAYVTSVSEACCKRLLKIFICFLDVCLQVFLIWMFYMFYTCYKSMFQWFQLF
jgi:hypothetical protein